MTYNLPYPDNLLKDIFGADFTEGRVLKEKPCDFDSTLQYTLSSCLSPRGQEIIRLRYKEGMGYSAIAKTLGLSETLVAQALQQPLRRLRHKRIKEILAHGIISFTTAVRKEDLAFYEKLLQDSPLLTEAEKAIAIAVIRRERVPAVYLPGVAIERLGLSNRSFALLKRADINTTEEIIELGEEGLKKLRGIGPTCVEEITAAVKNVAGYRI